MTGKHVTKIAATELVRGQPTPGLTRSQAIVLEDLWSGTAVTEPGVVSGWHHHGEHDTIVYVTRGSFDVETATGVVNAQAGDFVHVPAHTVHREGNSSDHVAEVVLVRRGRGPVVVNVAAPASVDVGSPVREMCLALPEVTEKLTHGSPGFFVRKQFVMLWAGGHHDQGFPHLWCAAPPGAQEALVASSDRYFRPPYVGHRGWIGVRLDGDVDWDEIGDLIEDAYREIAPRRLIAQLAHSSDGDAATPT
jgi:uncharacterized RmlC-like cupin family protein/predicted DNA-binding protein (MmcQ/YjbR family)